MIIMLATGCSKDKTEANASIPSNTLAKQLEKSAYQDFGSKPESTRNLMFSNAESLLAGQVKKSSGDMELGEAFISIEGIINYNFGTELDMFTETDYYSEQYQLVYYTDDGINYVDDNEFANTYQEIYNDLLAQSQADTTEEILLVDMEILGLDPVAKIVTINAKAVKAAPFNQTWGSPGNPYYAAAGAGICDSTPNTNWQNGVDAASILRGYSNMSAPWKGSCNNGVQYTAIIADLKTWNAIGNDLYMTQDLTGSYNTWPDVVSHFWQSNTNDCLGNNEQEWADLAGDINYLRNYGLDRVKAHINPNAQFYLTTFHSHYSSDQEPGNPFVNSHYYHGGYFYYSIITCN